MAQQGRLKWRCRRGMKELDLLLERYLERDYQRAVPEHQAAFRALLRLQDPQIFAYLLGRDIPMDRDLADVVERIRTADIS